MALENAGSFKRNSLRMALATGGAAGALACSGPKSLDTLVGVLRFGTTATLLSGMSDLTSEFSITGDGTIDNTAGTATTGSKLVVFYHRAETNAD
jgi:hypothetical protein